MSVKDEVCTVEHSSRVLPSAGPSPRGLFQPSGFGRRHGPNRRSYVGQPPAREQVTITNHRWFTESSRAGIRRTVKNVSDASIPYVLLQAAFLDDQGTKIGGSMDNVNDLSVGESAEFSIPYFGPTDEVSSYVLDPRAGY